MTIYKAKADFKVIDPESIQCVIFNPQLGNVILKKSTLTKHILANHPEVTTNQIEDAVKTPVYIVKDKCKERYDIIGLEDQPQKDDRRPEFFKVPVEKALFSNNADSSASLSDVYDICTATFARGLHFEEGDVIYDYHDSK